MSNPQGGEGHSLGLAVGATNLAGTGDGQRPVIRASAVTLQRGLTLTGFVDRVGDPVPMVAQDGSRHRPEMLLAEALDGVARNAARTSVSDVAVAVPAHWRPSMVEALRGGTAQQAGIGPFAAGVRRRCRLDGIAGKSRPADGRRHRAVRLRRKRRQHHPDRLRGRRRADRRDGPGARLLGRPDRPGRPEQGRGRRLRGIAGRSRRHLDGRFAGRAARRVQAGEGAAVG